MTARTLTPAELEQLAHALHRGDELTHAERTLYHRADSDMTGETGGDLIEAMDRLEAVAMLAGAGPKDRTAQLIELLELEAEARATAADCDNASADELEAAADIYDRLTTPKGTP